MMPWPKGKKRPTKPECTVPKVFTIVDLGNHVHVISNAGLIDVARKELVFTMMKLFHADAKQFDPNIPLKKATPKKKAKKPEQKEPVQEKPAEVKKPARLAGAKKKETEAAAANP